ncbi:MAG: tubulin-like doman-containing protein [Oscillospiraceae bacterium]
MEIGQKTEWLKPGRIQKLYDGQKSPFGMNRLFVIGIGRNGTDCVLRCMHLTEKRFGKDPKKVRFLCIGEQKQLSGSSFEGTVSTDGTVLPIAADEAIYKYLNNPAKLPEYAQDWFDSGLKNYSPATPTYGLNKRQCGRIALFHYLKQIMSLTADALKDFGGSDKPLEIVLTGNLGDTFFGGMFIDLAYMLTKMFESSSYQVRVNAYLFAADTAALIETDARDVGCYSANTIVAKKELDKFQCHKKHFSQKYSKTFEVDYEKPPFNACFLIPADENYDLTMSKAAEKILNRMEILFSKDDDAERIMSYNMLKPDASHDFRYLSYDITAAEIPLGKMMSYLGIKLFTRLNHTLNGNNVSEQQLSRYASKVTASMELVASKSGEIPTLEFDERMNQAFSAKSVRGSGEAALSAVETWLSAMKSAVINGSPTCVNEIADSIIADCEEAKTDFSKGPFYAQEILKKCFAELRVAMAKIKSGEEENAEQVERTRSLERAAMRKVKTSALFVNKAVDQYLVELKGYADASLQVCIAKPMIDFYQALTDRLNEYYTTTLQKAIDPFEQISMNRGGIIDDIRSELTANSCVSDAFNVSDEKVLAKLDELSESIPKEQLERYFKESGILALPENDEKALAKAVIRILRKCFEQQLSMNFSEMCDYFGIEGGVSSSIKRCIENTHVTAPATDKFSITRVVCPKAVKQEDIAAIRGQHKGVGYIWNGSVSLHETSAAAICGGVELEKFNGYQQWENMHYAYVNDSLKKHGIRIFK